VLPVSGDQNREAVGRMLPDDRLYMGDLGTGGIDDPETLFLDLISLGGGNSMGADDHSGAGGGAFDLVQTPDRDDASLSEELDRLRVMDQGAVSVNDFMTFVAGHVEDDIYGPLHSHTEPCGLCPLYSHPYFSLRPVPLSGGFLRQMKNSRLPAGPVSGDSQIPRTVSPRPRQNASISARTR
jgi:hypothetical protein